MVREFHEVFGAPIGEKPRDNLHDQKLLKLRMDVIQEEFEEFVVACTGKTAVVLVDQPPVANGHPDIVEMADALGDLLYVVIGAALTFGIDLEAVTAEIHASNMKKLNSDGTVKRNDAGEVVKPEGWQAPQIAKVLGVDKYGKPA